MSGSILYYGIILNIFQLTVCDQNKAHALINVHPPFLGRFTDLSIMM